MFRHLSLLAIAVLLGACQSQVNQDFDASRDFAAYRSWSWKEPALQYRPDDPRIKSDLTEQRIRQAVSDQLDQRGLRPASGAKGDLNVQTYLIVETRQQQVTSNYGGGYWGSPWHGYWGAPMYETRNITYTVATIQIDLLDAKDGKLVWRGSDEQTLSNTPNPADRSSAVRATVARILANYPPR